MARVEELAEICEHNYRATIKDDNQGGARSFRVSWADYTSDEEAGSVRRAATPTYVTVERLEAQRRKMEGMLKTQTEQLENKLEALIG